LGKRQDAQRRHPLGALAVAPHLGGGYLFWSQSRVFRSVDFTGSLVPVGLGTSDAADTTIRGIRNGLRGIVIATDAGPRELLPGANVASAFSDPGVTELVALDASRAIRLDALGRTGWTIDGGKTWNDATPTTGLGVRGLAAAPDELWFETWQGRALLTKDGTLSGVEGSSYRYIDYGRPFQMVLRGTRAERDDQFWWGYREMQPLQAALTSGVRLADGTGFGVLRGAVARVDLATGKVLTVATDWLPNGVDCQPLPMDGEVLFACSWEDYQAGGYVLRSDGTEPPHVERLFTDDGAFVTDDAGGFGYTGSCKAEQKFVDPDRYYGRYGRYGRHGYDGEEGENLDVDPVFCVRRGWGDWVERRLTLDEDTSLLAWIPRKDGTAIALVRGTGRGETLPDAARSSQRETAQNGVRVVRVFREVEGWFWGAQQVRSYYSRGGGPQALIDRRYRALDDGTIVGWLASSDSSDYSYSYQNTQKWVGGALRPDGRTDVFELPATPLTMAVTGPWGVLTTRDGKLFETLDRGRSWRSAGISSLAPGTMQGVCSALGCAFSTGARVGWGTPSASPRVAEEKREDPPKGKVFQPVITCEPQGMPKAEQSNVSPAAATLGSQAKVVIQTQFGATLEMIRETPDAVSSASPYAYPSRHGHFPPPPPPIATASPSASASASPKPGVKPAPVRTHTLVFRPPLDPLAPIVRHNATNAAVSGYRGRTQAVTLLGVNGDVSLLMFTDTNEALIDRNDIVTVPPFEARRYYYYDTTAGLPGLRTASNRAMLFGDFRRRGSWSTLEEHGLAPQKPPFYFAFDRDTNRRRVMTMARRDDGAMGLIVLDGAAPETVSLSAFDRVATVLGPLIRLAPWSSLVTADDPACGADKKAYRALVPLDPSVHFTLDAAKLPGVTFGKQGIMLVRWSEERVCLEAVDVAMVDPRRRPDGPTGENLVIRWTPSSPAKGAAKEPGSREATGALRSLELMQPLTCSLKR
jgi:hypothetical protein